MPYNSQLTEAEQKLGYVVMDVDNPRANYSGEPTKVRAVVFVLGESDVIIKLNDPIRRGVSYSHQRYGRYPVLGPFKEQPEPQWQPVGGPYWEPAQAIQQAQSGKINVKVIPCKPPK